MSETPGFTYSPEGLLTIAITLEGETHNNERLELLDELDGKKGVEVVDGERLEVDVKEALAHDFGRNRGGDVERFIEVVDMLMPRLPKDRDDYISHPGRTCSDGLIVTVYPHFQRWLNTQKPLDEGAAKEVVTAMAVSFGEEVEATAQRYFRMRTEQDASASRFGIGVFPGAFGIRRIQRYDTYSFEQQGIADWNWVGIYTLGECACLKARSDKRACVDVSQDSPKPWLYEMTSHNIEFPQQTLSFLMGIGALAYRAAEYKAQDDILADTIWTKGREYPFPNTEV